MRVLRWRAGRQDRGETGNAQRSSGQKTRARLILEAGGLRKQIDTYKKEARGNSEIVEGLEALAKKLEVAAEADNDV